MVERVAPAGAPHALNEHATFIPAETHVDVESSPGKMLSLELPPRAAAEGDAVLSEIFSWDKDGDHSISFDEVRAAAAAIRAARGSTRAWQRRFVFLGVVAALLVGALAGVLIGANEATKQVVVRETTSRDSVDADDDAPDETGARGDPNARSVALQSTSGEDLGLDVLVEDGPTLFELPETDEASAALLTEIVLPTSADEGADEGLYARVLATFRTPISDGQHEVSLWLSGAHLLRVRPTEATLHRDYFAKGTSESGDGTRDGTNDIIYHRGPQLADGTYDIIVAREGKAPPSAFSADAEETAEVDAGGDATVTVPSAARHVHKLERARTATLSALWHGSDSAEWHIVHNRHWRRRALLFHPTLGPVHLAGGLHGAAHHPDPRVRAAARVHPLQNAGLGEASLVFTREPPRLASAKWSTVRGFKNAPELPGMPPFTRKRCYKMAKKYEFHKSVKRQKKICKKLWKKKFKRARKACDKAHKKRVKAGTATVFARIRCHHDEDMTVCEELCDKSAANGRAAECRTECRGDQEDRFRYGRIMYDLDGTAARTSTFVPGGFVRCGNPKSIEVAGTEIEECNPTVVPPDGKVQGTVAVDAGAVVASANVTTEAWLRFDDPQGCLDACDTKLWPGAKSGTVTPLEGEPLDACRDYCRSFFSQRVACLATCATGESTDRSSVLQCLRTCETDTCERVRFWLADFGRENFAALPAYDADVDFDANLARKAAREACARYTEDITTVEGFRGAVLGGVEVKFCEPVDAKVREEVEEARDMLRASVKQIDDTIAVLSNDNKVDRYCLRNFSLSLDQAREADISNRKSGPARYRSAAILVDASTFVEKRMLELASVYDPETKKFIGFDITRDFGNDRRNKVHITFILQHCLEVVGWYTHKNYGHVHATNKYKYASTMAKRRKILEMYKSKLGARECEVTLKNAGIEHSAEAKAKADRRAAYLKARADAKAKFELEQLAKKEAERIEAERLEAERIAAEALAKQRAVNETLTFLNLYEQALERCRNSLSDEIDVLLATKAKVVNAINDLDNYEIDSEGLMASYMRNAILGDS